MIYAFLAILGLVFGSFYLVVATRLPEEKSIIKPGSHCDNCNHELKWYELIPVISYMLQKGKCRSCGAKIPFLTVIIELITCAAFVLPYYLYGFDIKNLYNRNDFVLNRTFIVARNRLNINILPPPSKYVVILRDKVLFGLFLKALKTVSSLVDGMF